MLLGVALPTLITDLGITPATGQWLTTGYLLTPAVLFPATGFLMQRFHLRTIFLSALTLFTVGTAVAAIAPDSVSCSPPASSRPPAARSSCRC
ncbi:MFS transporter [Streptomyces sp. NPDC005803]|uniref:MFS transporter n=1 Tax=Streptomyces sp. NPDC005803 TaxID=3154297 RepID=UPI0033FA48A2